MKIYNVIIISMVCLVVTGCAAGAATAGYAIKAQSADSLTASAEQRIVDRTKSEILAELTKQQFGIPCHVTTPN